MRLRGIPVRGLGRRSGGLRVGGLRSGGPWARPRQRNSVRGGKIATNGQHGDAKKLHRHDTLANWDLMGADRHCGVSGGNPC